MKLTAKLAYSQIKVKRKRTVWTLLGIVLATAMITAVSGFVASGDAMLIDVLGNDYYSRYYMTALIIVGLGLSSIITGVAVIAISNAFRVSAAERTMQFGILKSVGATGSQIVAIVMFEGLWLSVIGIPFGVALGMLVHFAGVEIANYLLTGINRINEDYDVQLILHFTVRWWALASTVFGSLYTVMLSAWLPARKAAKIAAIDAIRGTGEIKIKAKKVRANPIIEAIFQFEGTLASKSIKRSRRNFRASVVSLTISIILIIATSSIGMFGFAMTDSVFPGLEMKVVAEYSSSVAFNYEGDEISERIVIPLDYALSEDVTVKLSEYPDTEVYGIGCDRVRYTITISAETMTPRMRTVFGGGLDEYSFGVTLISTDAEHYEQLCRKAGVPLGSNILVNNYRTRIDEVRTEITPFLFRQQTFHLDDYHGLGENLEVPLHGELTYGEIPEEVMYIAVGNVVNIIVPECDMISYYWFTQAADAGGFTDYARDVLNDMIAPNDLVWVYVENVEAVIDAIMDIRNLILTFIYGFVGMLVLVALTNVISTISTNIRSRSREFAVLRSVGMTDTGIKRMLNLESILSSARALCFGLPTGCVLSYLSYIAITGAVDFPYIFPWSAVAQCVIGVFIITWVTMRYAASRLRGDSIVEAIRSEAV